MAVDFERDDLLYQSLPSPHHRDADRNCVLTDSEGASQDPSEPQDEGDHAGAPDGNSRGGDTSYGERHKPPL